MARKEVEKLTSVLIKRTAIDSNGCIGSFYDGYRDILCKENLLNNKNNAISVIQRIECVFKIEKECRDDNFFQIINKPEGGLRLSVLTGLTNAQGIASVIHYPYPINQYTRCLLYCYICKEEKVNENINKSQNISKASSVPSNATHIINGILYGIDIIMILRLPTDIDIITKIDEILERISKNFNNDKDSIIFNADEESILDKIMDIMVYSNISSFMELSNLHDIILCINDSKKQDSYPPISYSLQNIKDLYSEHNTKKAGQFHPLSPELEAEQEEYLLYLLNTVKNIKYSIDSSNNEVFYNHFERAMREKQHQLQELETAQKNILERIKTLIFDARKSRPIPSKPDPLWEHPQYRIFERLAKKLQDNLKDFKEKEILIDELTKQHIAYCNVTEHNIARENYKTNLPVRLKKNAKPFLILCTNDELNKKKPTQITRERNKLTEEYEKNPNISLTYADFSYSSVEPEGIEILSLNQTNNKKKIKAKNSSSASIQSKTSTPEIPNNNINILLLGETGVGKSTFINAFVNYLKFETFEEAQSNNPVVLMPVSFIITVGEHFEEHVVKFGDTDSSKNEDFDHPGESVTQHCKIYEFHLNDNDEQKLCIIDTPGFGDTRGLDQDDLNMQDILEYINNLTHLNAVCFLLKPNSSKLHAFFRMCFVQLLDLLGPKAHPNIIFCFTNARSTFYAPGDTGPVLKNLLQSLSMNDIPFRKANTFCFDNESFRYLVSLQNGITFNDDETHEYQMSWLTSVKESTRLIQYIREHLISYRTNDDWKSIKSAQTEIYRLIRPMLETLQNILRNIVLIKRNIKKKSIALVPKAIHQPASICLSCKPYPILIMSKIWIARNLPHEFLKKCLLCQCSMAEHIQINYVITYNDSNTPLRLEGKDLMSLANQLGDMGADFDYFLVSVAHSLKKDSFLTGLMRAIDEENQLCESQTPNHFNLEQVKILMQIKVLYEKRMHALKLNQKLADLPSIYKQIAALRKYPFIESQLEAMKQSQEMMKEPYVIS